MGIAEAMLLALGWLGCVGVAVRVAGRLGWWATLAAGVAGSTLLMHLPVVLAMTVPMSSQDRHLLAIALAIPPALPAAGLWLRRRRHHLRLGEPAPFLGRRQASDPLPQQGGATMTASRAQ